MWTAKLLPQCGDELSEGSRPRVTSSGHVLRSSPAGFPQSDSGSLRVAAHESGTWYRFKCISPTQRTRLHEETLAVQVHWGADLWPFTLKKNYLHDSQKNKQKKHQFLTRRRITCARVKSLRLRFDPSPLHGGVFPFFSFLPWHHKFAVVEKKAAEKASSGGVSFTRGGGARSCVNRRSSSQTSAATVTTQTRERSSWRSAHRRRSRTICSLRTSGWARHVTDPLF